MKECLPLMLGIEGTELSQEERELFTELQPAGYILFSRNIKDADSLRELTDELRAISVLAHPPIIAIDQEGGRVIRTAELGLKLPSARAMALSRDSALINRAARLNAWGLQSLGINTNFAPVLDAQSSRSNALMDRCWGEDTQDIISYAGMWNREHCRQGMLSCGKHFPGMGEAASDPHFDLPVLKGDAQHFLDAAAIPFLTLMPELPSLMMAHLLIPDMDEKLPSSLSHRIVHDFLRMQLGYEGLIFTDDLCMGAIAKRYSPAQSAPLALQAGCDVPLLCHDVTQHAQATAAAIEALPQALLDESRERIASFAERIFTCAPLPYVAWSEHLQECAELCALCPEPEPEPQSKEATASPVEQY